VGVGLDRRGIDRAGDGDGCRGVWVVAVGVAVTKHPGQCTNCGADVDDLASFDLKYGNDPMERCEVCVGCLRVALQDMGEWPTEQDFEF